MQKIATLINEGEHSKRDVLMFIGEIRRYVAITELDETVLKRLINHILLGEPESVKLKLPKTDESRLCKGLERYNVLQFLSSNR